MENSRDTIPIRPTTNQVLFPPNTIWRKSIAYSSESQVRAVSENDLIFWRADRSGVVAY